MKKNNSLAAFFLVMITILINVSISSCSKGKDSYSKSPVPAWKEDTTGKYPASMTAVVQLPRNLLSSLQSEDQLAAFAQDECRGVGVEVKVNDTSTVFYVMIHGTTSEQMKINFKYYSTKDSYLYTTTDLVNFGVDANYGTADDPAILNLQHVK